MINEDDRQKTGRSKEIDHGGGGAPIGKRVTDGKQERRGGCGRDDAGEHPTLAGAGFLQDAVDAAVRKVVFDM